MPGTLPAGPQGGPCGARVKAARAAALAEQQKAEAEAGKARLAAEQAERQKEEAIRQKEEMRARLLNQLNQVLETKDTIRGLVVSMPDVLFDTGQYTLKSAARERLARVADNVRVPVLDRDPDGARIAQVRDLARELP